MIIKQGNIIDSKCEVLVNAVNCIGVMGRGLALEFKNRYPDMYRDYRERCAKGELKVGRPYLYRNYDEVGILNFPTKDHWKESSKLAYIIGGLGWFVDNYNKLGITSIAFPALGCGCGGLDWNTVKELMVQKLGSLPIEIEVYAPV